MLNVIMRNVVVPFNSVPDKDMCFRLNKAALNKIWMNSIIPNQIELCHPQDGITNPKYKLLHF
jgi:hypothetical protein